MAGFRHVNPHYSGARSHRGTLRKADLNLSVSHLKFVSVILLVALVFVGRALNASPVPLAHAALAEIVVYDDAFQNGYSASDWAITPPANPAYAGDAFAGAFSLQKNLAITGGTGEFMALHSPAGFNTADYTHIDFYAMSISPEGAKVRVRFAVEPWEGSTEEVPIDVPSGVWTRYEIAFGDFGPTVIDKQYVGIAFSGGGPGAPFDDSDNDVIFDEIKVVKLADTIAPKLDSAEAIGSVTIRGHFSEKVSAVSAGATSNYVVSSATDANYLAGQNPSAAVLLPNERDVELTLVDGMVDGETYTLTASDVVDLSGNVIAAGSEASFAFADLFVSLSVNAANVVYPFNSKMRGSQLACWMHEQANKPGPDAASNLWEVAAPLAPGIIRYCGGLWSNKVGWDRFDQGPANGDWQYTDPVTNITSPYVYTHAYKPAWIDGLASFLTKVDADVMLQANLCDNRPDLWADMVSYANVENDYGFKYWELSNELDLPAGDDDRIKCFGSADKTFAAQEYAKRFVEYVEAMKAVDPTIKVMGPVTANYYSAPTWFPPLVDEMQAAGLTLDVLSWHWYQLFEWDEDPTSATYDFGSIEALLNYNTALTDLNLYGKGEVITDPDHWLYRSRRIFAEYTPADAKSTYALPAFPDVEVAVTEHNTHGADFDKATNGNHLGAIWMADVLGRAAYSGQDINIWYELYDGDFNKYGLIFPDDDVNPSKLFVRPTYYPMLMYSQWFGDTLVESSTGDPLQDVVVWASIDSADPDTLKLMLVNFNSIAATVDIDVSGFSPQTGLYYEMTSADPTSMDPALTQDSGQTSINGFTVDTTAGNVQASIDAIAPNVVSGISGNTVTHVLPAYSATSMVLSGAAVADVIPPFLSNLSPSQAQPSGTTQISLSLTTSEAATCRYGTTPDVTYPSISNTFTTTGGTFHSETVTGLADGQSYTYYVRCEDASGNANLSDATISFSIDTPVVDTIPPVVSNPGPSGTLAAGTTQATLVVTTDEAATCKYGATPGTAYESMPLTFITTGGTSHSSTISSLVDGQSYTYYARCEDAFGNANSADTVISFSVSAGGGVPGPLEWPAQVDLSVGESSTYTLLDGTTRTITLVSYAQVIPRHKIEATIEVSDGVTVDQHTLQVALAGVPVSVNGLRVYAYAWKEAVDFGFENIGWGGFPLTAGKDVSFALSDAKYSMFPDMDSFTYPVAIAFHEGRDLQTFLEPKDNSETSEAHSGYDIKVPSTAPAVAIRDGYVWSNEYSGQGSLWITPTNSQFGDPDIWFFTHRKAGPMLNGIQPGDFVTKGTPLAYRCDTCSPHFHMGGRNSFDFGSYAFTAEIWNNEHRDDFPAPRYWLVLGAYAGDLADNHIAADETGDISSTIAPRVGDVDKDGVETWKFGDNMVNSVVAMNELLSAAPFSGYNVDRNPTDSVGYAATYVFSPDDHTGDSAVWLNLGSSYGAKIWLNGQSIFDNSAALAGHRYDTYDTNAESTLIIDESLVALPLVKGWNSIILKTNHGSRGNTAWRFSPKIGDIAGNRIAGLEFGTRDIDLQVTSEGDDRISLSWSAPSYHGTFVETYLIDVATDAGFNSLIVGDLDAGNVTGYTVTGLSSGQQYYVRVKPYNGSEMGGTVLWQHVDSIAASTTGIENFPFSQSPPGGLASDEVPLFITLGSDDNWKPEGVDWLVNGLFANEVNPPGDGNAATFDGTPARGSFYVIGELEGCGEELRDAFIDAYQQGHEIGNHAYRDADQSLDAAGWTQSIGDTNRYLTGPLGPEAIVVNTVCGSKNRVGLELPQSAIYGFRAPHDAYNDALFPVLTDLGFTYHSSTAQGHTSQSVDGSTDLWWPGTLDNGIPYANSQSGVSDTGHEPGMWELPQNYMWLPPTLGSGTIGYCDADWTWEFRDEVGYDDQTRADAITSMLKHNLDLRLAGNRSPLHLCLHSQNWGLASWEQTPEDLASMSIKQAILKDFLAYALSFPQVRLVRQIDVINWMRNPVPLGEASTDTTPPSQPTALTATAVSGAQIDLTWSSATDAESGIATYNVYRDGTVVATVSSTSYSDTGLSPATTYTYEVSATNGAGLEGLKSAATVAITPDTTQNPPITPLWAFEPWVWEDDVNTQASTETLVDDYLARDMPVGVVIVDSPWETDYNTFEWDAGRYSDPQGMIDGLHAKGVRVINWITGFENQTSPDYDFVKTNGYAVDSGQDFDWWKGTGVHVDFTNPAATDWWHTKMDQLLGMGIDGWKVDMSADHLNPTVGTSIGDISMAEFKGYYYGDFFDYTLSQNPEGIILARPYSSQGGNGAPVNKLSIGWTGDNDGSWSGLQQQIGDIYRSAEDGYGAFGAEIGGYCCTEPTKNLLIRWTQLGAMLPLMENGGSNGGLTAHLPWFHDQQTEDIYRYFATLHSELAPYNFSYGVEANLSGLSIVRSPDSINNQHKLGEDIFVAVLDSDVTQRSVTFPTGADWVDLWDHAQIYAGGTTVTYDVALDRYPIFIRSGGIIPMHVEGSLTGFGDSTSAGMETILIFPDGQSTFVYHRPTGEGIAYTDVAIDVDEALGTIDVDGTIDASYRLTVRWPAAPASVSGADAWQYDDLTGFLTIDRTGTTFQVVIADVLDTTPPSTPSNLSAVAVSTSQIDLSWDSATDAESGILHYKVYRDGASVGTATATSFSDFGLAEGSVHTYEVSAVNGVGTEGAKSSVTAQTLSDTVAPSIQSVTSSAPTSVIVVFSEPVEQASAEDAANYTVDNGITVSSASLGGDLETVTLTTSAHSEGVTYTLTVNNVRDRAAASNAIAADSQMTYTSAAEIVISGLTVASGKAYQVVDQGLIEGAPAFIDRGYEATSVPGVVAGNTYIKTANDDKTLTDAVFLTFDVNEDVTLYVAHDDRIALKPLWMGSFVDSGLDIVIDSHTHSLWSQDLAAGTITLGANEGVADSSMYIVVVKPASGSPVNVPPVAAFSASPTSGFAPLDVTFDSIGSSDSDGSIVSYDWSFGDGSTALGAVVSHQFAADGTYTVTLTVTDDDGATGEATAAIIVGVEYPTLPGMSSQVQDLDGDGKTEDLNGNSRVDFADVVVLFDNMVWIDDNGFTSLFDYNCNAVATVDMDDVQELFNMVVGSWAPCGGA